MALVTSRTPLRVSFFGGGTDYPEYFEHYPGAVLGTAIDKHVYISAIKLERFMGYSYRLAYRKTEEVQEIAEIEHPMFRVGLDYLKIEKGWNFGVLTSLPSMSGLGSSSSFAVGLLKLLGHLKGVNYTRHDLASLAIYLEREILKENVGIQDQTHAAYGSLNRYEFNGSDFMIHPVRLHSSVRDALNSTMYLVHTGTQRYASDIVREQLKSTKERKIIRDLDHLYALTRQAHGVLEGQNPEDVIQEIGRMLHDSWMTKRGLSTLISSDAIDLIYATALEAGAVGGKLCGAGGGGFFLVLVPEHKRDAVQAALGERQLIPIAMDDSGSTLILS
jgi:D-glycero-alpha-D-manno-heptose-7-phosphate kinase